MITNGSQRRRWNGFSVLATIIALGVIGVPLIFGNRVTVSPMLLFFIVILCNVAHCIVPQRKEAKEQDEDAIFNRVFFIRLAISGLFSILLIAIYQVAMTFK